MQIKLEGNEHLVIETPVGVVYVGRDPIDEYKFHIYSYFKKGEVLIEKIRDCGQNASCVGGEEEVSGGHIVVTSIKPSAPSDSESSNAHSQLC